MNFNMYYAYANGAVSGCYDTYSVFLHESGHTAGLDHSSLQSAVMYKYVYTNTLRRTLSSDDKQGIASIY